MSVLLDVQAVRAGYGRITVLKDLSLCVGSSESVALLGANGHGKTTLLEVLSGVVRATSGAVTFDGRVITGQSPHVIAEMGLIHVPQGNPLFPRLTVLENLMLGGRLRRARSSRSTAMEQVYDLFPKLRERSGQLVGTLSGGERQMVAIGMGLMAQPRLLILDEPTLGLAPKVRAEILRALREVRARGLTLLVTDGDIDFLFDLTDRWYGVELGRVVSEGTAAERPSREEVMNMYVGSAKDQDQSGGHRYV